MEELWAKELNDNPRGQKGPPHRPRYLLASLQARNRKSRHHHPNNTKRAKLRGSGRQSGLQRQPLRRLRLQDDGLLMMSAAAASPSELSLLAGVHVWLMPA
eukprot:scaffold300115_cov17-Tisochrysis_lutea.AAC.1